ncbi:hypothetical protein D3C87_1758890 [compost metagenome]
MANQRRLFNIVRIERIQQILRHHAVGHLRAAIGKPVVAHIHLQDIVIGHQIARQHAQVIETAKQAMNQYDGGIIVRRLCRLRSAIQFHGKVLFLQVSG